jgi:single-strand DNA-binding protein
MNLVRLTGNAGQDVTMKVFENGKMAQFKLATSETYLNKNQEEVKTTQWHTIVAWGKTAEACEQVVTKGKLLQVEGKITYRQYVNKENQTVYITEIVAFNVQEPVKKAAVVAT